MKIRENYYNLFLFFRIFIYNVIVYIYFTYAATASTITADYKVGHA